MNKEPEFITVATYKHNDYYTCIIAAFRGKLTIEEQKIVETNIKREKHCYDWDIIEFRVIPLWDKLKLEGPEELKIENTDIFKNEQEFEQDNKNFVFEEDKDNNYYVKIDRLKGIKIKFEPDGSVEDGLYSTNAEMHVEIDETGNIEDIKDYFFDGNIFVPYTINGISGNELGEMDEDLSNVSQILKAYINKRPNEYRFYLGGGMEC